MARLKIASSSNDKLATLHQKLTADLSPTGDVVNNISTEAINVIAENKEPNSTFANSYNKLADTLRATFAEAFAGSTGTAKSLGFESLDNAAALEAASIIAMVVSGDKNTQRAYHMRAVNTAVASQEDVAVILPGSQYGYMDSNPSMEAFDNRNLENLRGYNVLFAFASAIQDEFSETLFRTVTLNPDSAGLEISLQRTVVMQEVVHPTTGQYTGWEYHNLLDAVSDPSILQDNTTRIYPKVIVGDAKSEELFTPAADIAPSTVLGNGGAPVLTAPLRPGADIPLMGIGHNDKIPGTLNQTDSLDHNITVTKLYFKVTTAAGTSVLAFDTSALMGNNFLKSQQYRDRRVNLDFDVRDLVITGNTLDITGAPAAALAPLLVAPYDDVVVKLRSNIAGHADLQFGNINVNKADGKVGEARKLDADGTYETITDTATLDAIKAIFTSITLIGYDVKAFRTNLNRRQLGLLIDSVTERTRYMVPLSAPISLQTPITDTATANDLAAPLNAIRLRNSVNAVTKLIEVRDTLRQVTPEIGYRSPTDPAPQIEGFGRLMVRPVLFEDTVNVANVIQSTSSQNRYNDVVSTIVNKLRYGVNYIYTESRYQPAVDALNGTAGEKPLVVIGTDPTTAAYLMTQGDPRVVFNFEHKVVVSYDVRMRNQIVATFVRPGVSDVDVLSFGCMANIPELVTNAVLNYGGSNTQVTQVQSRTLHVCTLPVMVWLKIDGLEQGASDRVPYAVITE